MQFILIDRIVAVEPGRRIVAVKNLTLAEEYLAEHFPGFPILPGVLMLEAVAQAAAWLIRLTDGYAHSVVVTKSVKALKYGHFVQPGQQLRIEAEITKRNGSETELKAKGTLQGVSAVAGRVTMEAYNLGDREPGLAMLDREIVDSLKRQYALLARELRGSLEQGGELAGSASAVRV